MDQRNHRRGRYQRKPPAGAGNDQRRKQEIQEPQYQICLSLLRHHYPGNARGQCNLWGLRRAFRAGMKTNGGDREASAKLFLYFLAGNFSASAYLKRCSNSKLIMPAARQLKRNPGFILITVNLLKQEKSPKAPEIAAFPGIDAKTALQIQRLFFY